VLLCVAVDLHYGVLLCVAAPWVFAQVFIRYAHTYTAVCYGVLQCVAAVAVDLCAGIYPIRAHIHCSFFQCVAMCRGCIVNVRSGVYIQI